MNLLKKTALCLLAAAFLAGSIYAGTATTANTSKKSTAAKTETKKNDPFGADNKDTKKDKTTPIPTAGWNGTITITPTDASGKQTVSFTNSQDSKQHSIQIDDASKKLLANIKAGSKVLIKGNVVVKADGTSFIKLTDCTVLPNNPPQPAS